MKWIIIVIGMFFLSLNGCSSSKDISSNQGGVFFYLGSGFDQDKIEVYFNDSQFELTVTTDFSIGVVLSSFFKCLDQDIYLIENGSIIETKKINTCDFLKLTIKGGGNKLLEQKIDSSKGKYIMIDKDQISKLLKVYQSKKPIIVE
ncbi:MAG: hypothetical protein KDD32_13035 [Bacteroidetes bacterium]|nr:hypothetical protein [Bacteroidota bacterium]